jgi:MFS family permease
VELRTLDPIEEATLSRVTRAVVINQALWTAGYSLTTGGFLTYFGYELGASGILIGLLLVIPETVGIAGLLSRWIIHYVGNRKAVWLGCALIARFSTLGIPLLAFPNLRPAGINPLWSMAGLLAVAQTAQAISYMAYLSWLSDLVPEQNWGRFFAKRNIARVCLLLVVPVAGGYLRDYWRANVTDDLALLAYVAAFGVGTSLQLASLWPLMKLPNVAVRSAAYDVPNLRLIGTAFCDRSFRRLLVHSWWLAFAQGLTQVAFFKYRIGPLGISLTTYYVLANVMLLVNMPLSVAAGWLADRFGNKWLLFWGAVGVSFAMPFWFLAAPGRWQWLFGAYFMWGGFAVVNISGRNLMLKLSPRSDNTAHIALLRQVGGLLAGASGLLGGFWIDSLLDSKFQMNWLGWNIGGFQLIFLVSFVGRFTAALWVLPIQEHGARSLGWMLRALRRLQRIRNRH